MMKLGIWLKNHQRLWVLLEDLPDKPAPISDAEAHNIMNRIQEGVEKPKHKVLFEPGEVVRVIDGPFNDFNGVVEEVRL